jgi:hypothetical protein
MASRSVASVVIVIALLPLACATTARITVPRTATEQIISTEAIDRALAQIAWPDVRGEKLIVQVGGPEESLDRDYLLRSVEVLIAQRGGIVVDDEDAAVYELNVLVGAVGIDFDGRFVGVKGVGSSWLIPFTIPELALYKTVRLDGFAKVEIALLDHRNGGVVQRSGPAYGLTYGLARTIFFVFRDRWTDTTRLERPAPREEDAY